MTLSPAEKREVVALRLQGADQALADAAILLEKGSVRGAVNRSYYAVFYAASALAVNDGKTFRKHSALIAYFHEGYVKSGRLPRDLGRILQKAFDARNETDYQDVVRLSPEDAGESLRECRRFVADVRAFLAGRARQEKSGA